MKQLVVLLLVAALAAPSLAVTFSAADNADGTLTISMDTQGAVVRGVALKLTCSGGAKLVSTTPVAVNAAFNTFIDYAFTTGETYAIGAGNPFADAAAAGVAAVDATVFSISMGVLDEAGAQAGYNGSAALITVDTGAGAVLIEADTLRGPDAGVVGDAALTSNLPLASVTVTDGPGECIPASHADYTQWSTVGKPASWCNVRQCYGEANGATEVFGKGSVWVGMEDLNILLGGFRKAYVDPLTTPWISADASRSAEVFGKGTVRVGMDDLNILLANFRKATVGTDCNN